MLKHRVCIEKDSLLVGGYLNNPAYSGLSCWKRDCLLSGRRAKLEAKRESSDIYGERAGA